jgi:phosphate:Na+ symporter
MQCCSWDLHPDSPPGYPLVPQKDEDEEEFRLKYINTGILSTAELSLFQAKKEISLYATRTKK